MMTTTPLVVELMSLFTRQYNVNEERENHVHFVGTYSSKNLGCPASKDLIACFKSFPSRDNLFLSIIIEAGEPTILSSADPDSVNARLEELSQKMKVADADDEVVFKINIEKNHVSNVLTVYSLLAFQKHFEERNTKECLSIFGGLIGQGDHTILAVQAACNSFGSTTIRFEPESSVTYTASLNRGSILDRLKDISHFADIANSKLVPEDFNIKGDAPKAWAELFLRLANTLSLAFLADYSAFDEGDILRFKINGYRVVSGTLNCHDLTGSNWNAAFRIYQWVYQGGSSSDKVGLLRNVVTLHLDKHGLPKLDSDVFKSVCSSFEIYLKRNVGQYIELKNRLYEFLRNLGKDGREEAGKYSSALIQNVGALLSFFITTIIVNGVSGKGLQGVFTRDITYLTNAFLGGSLVYLALSVYIFLRQRTRIKKDFNTTKEQYADLLDQEDLARLFKTEQINEIIAEMRRMAIGISLAWIIVVLGLGYVTNTLYLSTTPNTPVPQTQIPATQPASSPVTSATPSASAVPASTTMPSSSISTKPSNTPVTAPP